jgi:hypothetical protein
VRVSPTRAQDKWQAGPGTAGRLAARGRSRLPGNSFRPGTNDAGASLAAFYSMSRRAFFARAAPIAVFTSFSSSGGGSTAGIPSESIQSSRLQPCEW